MHLIVGPPASGKTTRLLELAQEFLARRKRVWWIALPAQRAYVYRRATERGAVLGLEVLTSQQLYYRLLAASFGLKPILTGPGRVALTGDALRSGDGPLPSPGEARLFARSIAEAKRYGVRPGEVPLFSPESRRLAQVYGRYEELKDNWGRWDYDDFRFATLELLSSDKVTLEADLIIVDGFRELSPLELRIFELLSQRIPVYVALPEAPTGVEPKEVLPAARVAGDAAQFTTSSRYPLPTKTYRAPNPVSEARWILRSIKRDLALGMSVLEVAVLAPESRIPALLTLADEYGVPLVDQTADTAAETPEGRLLLELLDLPDYPTPTRLLAVPDLVRLGRAALERNLVGREVISRLAQEIGMLGVWTAWLERLEPKGQSIAWANELLDSLPEVRNSPRRATLLERAKEAERIATGPDFRHWWAALLSETYEAHRPPGGVAVLTPTLASGQRWKKLYLSYAVEGAYGSGEREDYFIPEELRQGMAQVFEEMLGKGVSALPKRYLGRDRLLLSELRTRADEVVITYPEASQEGPLEPEPALVFEGKAPRLPQIPPASVLELAGSSRYQAPLNLVNLGKPDLESLRRYNECGLKYWAEQFVEKPHQDAWWIQLVAELRRAEKLVPARLETLTRQFPQAEGWLRHYAPELGKLNLGFKLEGQGIEARLDGVLRQGTQAHIYLFVAPDLEPDEASQIVRSRWSERWAAGYLLQAFQGRMQKVFLYAWPVLGAPGLVYDKPIEKVWGVLERLQHSASETHSRYKSGVVEPKPGFICRECRVRDVCREGKTG